LPVTTYTKMKVQFIFRKFNSKFQSIEELFGQLINSLPKEIDCCVFNARHYSTGLRNRVKILFEVTKLSANVFHITGDIHFVSLVLPRKRTVLTIHDLATYDNLDGISRFVFWLFWIYLPVKKLKYITVISEVTKQHLLSLVTVNPDKVLVIHNMLVGNFKPVYKEFNKNCPVILQVGITENKNILRLAEALAGINCKLVILGIPNAKQQEALKKHNIYFEVVHSLTRVEVIRLYNKCDFVTFISTQEGFGLPIIEANAVGRAVITSNISSMPEAAGNSAHLVNPFSVEDIRNGIVKIITDDQYREDIIKKGFENIKRFKPEVIAKQYTDLYNKILKD
jgi:glycosyltransferase involved in cell wall biosynthesis